MEGFLHKFDFDLYGSCTYILKGNVEEVSNLE